MSEHWLQHAHGRIVAGDDELDVLADYGWVQITDEEREAIEAAIAYLQPVGNYDSRVQTTLRSLLARLA